MWIHIFPMCLAGVLLTLFGYLLWLRPEKFLRNWVAYWGGMLIWSGLLWMRAVHPSAGRAEVSEGVFVGTLAFLLSAPSANVPVLARLRWLPMTVAIAGCLSVLVLPQGWTWLPATLLLLGAGLLAALDRHHSLGKLALGITLVFWAAAHAAYSHSVRPWVNGGQTLAMVVLALSMMLILTERESQVTEGQMAGLAMLNLPDPELHSGQEVQNALDRVLGRLEDALQTGSILLWAGPPYQSGPMRVSRGFSPRFQSWFDDAEAHGLVTAVARHSGVIMFRELHDEARGALDPACDSVLAALREEPVRGAVAVLLQAKSRPMGLLLVGRERRREFRPSELRFLLATSNQIAIALENVRLLAESRRRSGEFEILTHIGTALSSSLDLDALLRLIHAELQKLIDVRNFYVAFLDDGREEIQFALEMEDGRILPKRRRRVINALTEYVIRTGKPLLISRDLAGCSQQLGIVMSGRQARCWVGVPIVLQGRPMGVIAVQNYEQENAYDHEHLEILEIVAGQAGVAIDNARLFAEVQRDARQMSFLNQIARLAISTLQTQDMLQAVADEIWKAFHYDHVGIGVINYRTRELEFRAEAGSDEDDSPRPPLHVPLESGIVGKVARAGQMMLVQDASMGQTVTPLYEDSRSVLVIPIIYSGQTMGVLNLESCNPYAFPPEQVLVLQTLADQLAVAFNNALNFQQMQQQAITDSLTGLKTRRYFMEALNSEFGRARRSSESFCVLVIDMNGFKQINDTLGHLEGDLVLARVARILEQKSRASSVVARYGGDEFTILIPGANMEQGRTVAQRLQDAIEQDPLLAERGASASVGVGCYPDSGTTAEDILRAADTRMYSAKKEMAWNSPRRPISSSSGTPEKALPALYALAQSVDNHRGGDSDHSLRVADFAVRVARRLRLPVELTESIQIAGRLHDIGKSGFPGEMFRSGPFSPAERLTLQEHPRLGAELLRTVGGMNEVADLVACHHERLDGSGYPQGLRGDQIPLGARILAAVEEFVNVLSMLGPEAEADPRRIVQQIRESAPHAFDIEILQTLAAVATEGSSAAMPR